LSTTEDWQRAGFEVHNGKLERIKDATDIRADRIKRGRANLLGDGSGQAAELERTSWNAALVAAQTQAANSGRFLVRVISVRRRLLDEDNLCEKYHVDCCRYAGVLPKDSPGTAKIEVTQEKAEPGAAEEVRIEIYKI
jgi:hypothetical protein